MIDIRAYQPSFITELVGVFPPGVLVGSVGDWLQPEDSEEDVPAPELQDALAVPAHMPRGARFLGGHSVHLLFDGGS